MNPSPDPHQHQKLTLLSCHIRPGFGLAFLLVVALSAGAALERWFLRTGIPASAAGDFQLMAQAWDIIDKYYVDRPAVRHANMAAGAINGMTEALGDTGHSVYLTALESRKAGAAVQGKLNGIGVDIVQSTKHEAVVVAPIDGSPAQQAGVRPGDVILQVDGHSVSGLPLSHISARMSGEVGQSVALTVFNPSDGLRREIKIVRAAMKINNVSWQRLPGSDSKLMKDYFRQALEDTLTLYLHGLCCDIDVETGPRQLPSRHLRKRLEALKSLFPPPEGHAVFPEDANHHHRH